MAEPGQHSAFRCWRCVHKHTPAVSLLTANGIAVNKVSSQCYVLLLSALTNADGFTNLLHPHIIGLLSKKSKCNAIPFCCCRCFAHQVKLPISLLMFHVEVSIAAISADYFQ